MCVMSSVSAYYETAVWPNTIKPWVDPGKGNWKPDSGINGVYTPLDGVSKKEFDEFKETVRKDLEAIKDLIKAAKAYDEKTNQPDCTDEDKVKLIKKLAELVGVDLGI